LKITFLGTGTSQGIPAIGCDCEVCTSIDYRDQRLRSAIHIQTDDDLSIVIDCGPDFRQQMLRERIHKLDAIIYTHEHRDHVSGLDDIRPYNYLQKKPLQGYAHQRVVNQLKNDFSYAFSDYKYPGVPEMELNIIENKPFTIGKTTFIPIEVMHHKLPVFGFRIGDFTYITDCNYISDEEFKKIEGSKIFVINGLQYEPHIAHFTFEESLAVVHKIKPEKAFFTHISHKLGKHASVEKKLPPWIRLGFDGMQLEI
jgi:phosphoribosyl 1,2-cyclic phosphate phosphodiesterase